MFWSLEKGQQTLFYFTLWASIQDCPTKASEPNDHTEDGRANNGADTLDAPDCCQIFSRPDLLEVISWLYSVLYEYAQVALFCYGISCIVYYTCLVYYTKMLKLPCFDMA